MTEYNVLKPNFNILTSKVNVQVYKVGATSHMWDGVIMKSRKSHYRQGACHAYFTYIQTSNQAIRDQKKKKGTNNPKTKKTIQKLINLWKFSQKYEQKGYMIPPYA